MAKAAVQKLPRTDPEHISGIFLADFFLGEISGPPLARFRETGQALRRRRPALLQPWWLAVSYLALWLVRLRHLIRVDPTLGETNRNSLSTENEMVATKDKFSYYIEEDG